MRMIYGLCIVMLFVIGQSHANEVLDFKKVMHLAFENHPDMLKARAALRGAHGDLMEVRRWLNPELSFEFGGLKKDDAGKRDLHLDTFEVRQPFEPLGVNFLKSKIAANDLKIQEKQLNMVWAQVFEDMWQQYSDIMMNKKKMELAQKNLEVMRLFYGKVQSRFQAGQILKNELQRGKIELLKAEGQSKRAQSEVLLSQARLNVSLGRAIDSEFDIADVIGDTILKLNFEEIQSQALANRPDIQAAKYQLESSQLNITKENLERLPSYYVGFQKSDKAYDKDYALTFGLSLNLWGFNQGNIEKAKAANQSEIVSSHIVTNDALLDVYVAFWQVQAQQQTLEIAKQALEESHELLHLAITHYSEGKIDFLNYLDQVTTVLAIKTDYYTALIDYSQSISRLERAMYGSLRGEEGFYARK